MCGGDQGVRAQTVQDLVLRVFGCRKLGLVWYFGFMDVLLPDIARRWKATKKRSHISACKTLKLTMVQAKASTPARSTSEKSFTATKTFQLSAEPVRRLAKTPHSLKRKSPSEDQASSLKTEEPREAQNPNPPPESTEGP